MSPVPSGYYGLDWINEYIIEPNNRSDSGYITALSSGRYVGFNGNGEPMSIGVGMPTLFQTFHIKSFVACAAWNTDLQLSMTGERLGVIVYNQTVILQVRSATNVVLDWNNIDNIKFETSGGIPMPNHGPGFHFAMDNLCMVTGYASYSKNTCRTLDSVANSFFIAVRMYLENFYINVITGVIHS